MIEKDLNLYLKQTEKFLICEKREKKEFLRELQTNVMRYIEDENVADMDKIRAHFGTPQEIANSFLSDMDAADIKKKLAIKKAVIIALVIMVLIVSLVYICAFLDAAYFTDKLRFVEEIVVVEQMCIRGCLL